MIDVLYPISDDLAQKAQEEIDKVVTELSITDKFPSVRATGDEVYLIKDNEKHWITNPETYSLLGYKFGDEIIISPSELANYKTGQAITKVNYQEFIKPVEEVIAPTEPVEEQPQPSA